MKIFIHKAISIISILFLLFTLTSFSQISKNKVEEYIITIGILNGQNFCKTYNENTTTGNLPDYLNELTQYMNITNNKSVKFKYILGDETHLENLLADGKVDVITTFSHEHVVENDNFIYSKPILSAKLTLLTNNNSKYLFKDFENLNNAKIGYVDDFNKSIILDYAKLHNINFNPIKFKNIDELYDALNTHQIDLMGISLHQNIDETKIIDFICDVDIVFAFNTKIGNIFINAQNELNLNNPEFVNEIKNSYAKITPATKLAYTKQEEAFLNTKPIINVACSDKEPDMVKLNLETNQFEGPYVEILNNISENTGLQFNIKLIENMQSAIEQKSHLLMAIYKNSQIISDNNIILTEPFIYGNLTFIGYKGAEHILDDNKTVAINTGFESLYDYLNDHYPTMNFVYYDNSKKCIEAVQNKSVDFAILDNIISEKVLLKNNYHDVEKFFINTPQLKMVMGVNITYPYANELEKVLNKYFITLDKNIINSIFYLNNYSQLTIIDYYEKYQLEINTALFVIIVGLFIFMIVKEKKLYKKAYFDPLTKLHNRNYALSIQSKFLGNETTYAVLIVDISKMKQINNLFGEKIGNDITVFVGQHLQNLFGPKSLVCRDYGTNFIVITPYKSEAYLVEQINSAISKINIYQKDKVFTRLDYKIGICVFKRSITFLECINNAETVLYQAKQKNKKIIFYDVAIIETLNKEKFIEDVMQTALDNNEFQVYYQPKYSLRDNACVGAEALVRWIRPDGTMIYPDDFISIFERNGFIINLDNYVYESVCKLQKKLIDAHITPIPISVNQSRLHLENPNYIEVLESIADKYKIPHSLIEFELTEYIYGLGENMTATISKIKDIGFKISIDDFGSGYSSLNMLKYEAVDFLKLDRLFLDGDILTSDVKAVLNGIVKMSKALNIETICEGVESLSHVDFLKSIDCEIAQGYFFSKPISSDEFLKKIYNI